MKTLLPVGGMAAAGLSSRSTPITLLVAGAFFMENLDGTIIITAVPRMATAFDVHPIDLNIGASAYLLTLAVLIPASSWWPTDSTRAGSLPAPSRFSRSSRCPFSGTQTGRRADIVKRPLVTHQQHG
jgi:hypothetical protein